MSLVYDEIVVGEATYALRKPVRSYIDESGKFHVDFFSDHFDFGNGKDFKWQHVVHAAIQRIFRMQPFELSAEDKILAEALRRLIYIDEYWSNAPIYFRRIGRVLHDKGEFVYPKKVEWADGVIDKVDLHAMPAVFSRFRPDDCFEASCKQRPNGQDFEVVHVQWLPPRYLDVFKADGLDKIAVLQKSEAR